MAGPREKELVPLSGQAVSRELPGAKCPKCGHGIEHTSTLAGPERPLGEGDLAVCISCDAMLLLGGASRVRALTPAEFAMLPEPVQAALVKAQLLTRAYRATFGRN